MTAAIVHRARMALQYHPQSRVVRLLVGEGVEVEIAYLAVKAAVVMERG